MVSWLNFLLRTSSTQVLPEASTSGVERAVTTAPHRINAAALKMSSVPAVVSASESGPKCFPPQYDFPLSAVLQRINAASMLVMPSPATAPTTAWLN